MASITGDWTTQAWGIEHTHYHIAYLADASADVFRLRRDPAAEGRGRERHLRACREILRRALPAASALLRKRLPYAPLRPFSPG